MPFQVNGISATLMRAIKRYGKQAQIDVAIEEMAELTKALIKNRRKGGTKAVEDIIEEMADVQITLDQLALIFGDYDVARLGKIERLRKRMNAEDEAKKEAEETLKAEEREGSRAMYPHRR